MSQSAKAKKERELLTERQQLVSWYKLTQRINLKRSIRKEIAAIDRELRGLTEKKIASGFAEYDNLGFDKEPEDLI